MPKEPINKTLLYAFDPEETYEYNTHHGSVYPYNKFPKGVGDKEYKRTRFIRWEPKPDDIVVRHVGSQIHINWEKVLPNEVNESNKNMQLFKLRNKRLTLQNLICEQLNFFMALYDDDNDLITSMWTAKLVTDSESYTIATFDEYADDLIETLFPQRTIAKIQKMVEENDVGDDIVGLFSLDCLRDMFIVTFMIKVMYLYIEHFILLTGNNPKYLYNLFASANIKLMNRINPNMYTILYNYVKKNVAQTIAANANIYDMQAIDGVTLPTMTESTMRKTLLCDGLIKLTFASEWDSVNKRPTYSCVGLIKSIINKSADLSRRVQLRYSLITVDDVSQIPTESISSSSTISMIRSFNPGEYCCMTKDLNIIIGEIALVINMNDVDFYLEHLNNMNDLSKILIKTILYNKFHSSISIDTLSNKQKYILLLYVRHLVMEIYNLSEEDTKGNALINILMGKTTSQATRTLTSKDINGIKKYVKLNNLKDYLLSAEKNVAIFVENIMNCVMSSYTIVNHNAPELLDTQLVYEASSMTLQLLDMIVELFDRMYTNTGEGEYHEVM